MARIFDNIQQDLLGALRATLAVSSRADFCVGYLNLRGWQSIDDLVQPWAPLQGQVCRVLVGMQRPPQDDIRELYGAADEPGLDNATATRLKAQFAAHLREQITLGIPTGRDEAALRTLARQLRAGQVCIKLFLPYPLHAKLRQGEPNWARLRQSPSFTRFERKVLDPKPPNAITPSATLPKRSVSRSSR